LYVGDFGAVGFEWCPGCRLKLATRTPLQTSHTKSPTHNEPRTKTTDVVNSTAKSQAPDDGYINVRNMLST